MAKTNVNFDPLARPLNIKIISPKDTAPNQWEIGFLSELNEILHSCRLGHKEQTFYGSHPPGTPRLTSRGSWRSIIMTFPDL